MYKTNKKQYNFTDKYLKNWLRSRSNLNPQLNWDETVDTLRNDPYPPLNKRDGKKIVAGPYAGFYSCKVGVGADRVLYTVSKSTVYFVFIGSHQKYDRFIK